MSDRSQSEDRLNVPRDFAGHRQSFLLATSSHAISSHATPPIDGMSAPHSAPHENASGETIAGLIHDTRNMVMALDLYCDLLDEPGVLSASFGHYARELRLVSGASRRLMERLDRLSNLERRAVMGQSPGSQEIAAVNLLNFPDTSKDPEANSSFPGSSSMARMRSKSAAGTEISPVFGASYGTAANPGKWFAEAGPENIPSDSPMPLRRGTSLPIGTAAGFNGVSGESADPLVRSAASSAERSAERSTHQSAEQRVSDPGTVALGKAEPGQAAIWPERRARSRKPLDLYMDRRIEDLAVELRANHNLLSALAGPGVTVGMSIAGGHAPVSMAPEDLTRVLVNLVRNAVEAMSGAGKLQISLEEGPQFMALSFADDGPGIPREVLDKVFSPGYSSYSATRNEERSVAAAEALAVSSQAAEGHAESKEPSSDPTTLPSAISNVATSLAASGLAAPSDASTSPKSISSAWPIQHRGLGLSIVRAIVTAAGGSVWASNRSGKSAAASSWASEAIGKTTSGIARDAPIGISAQEKPSSGAIIHIEFPSAPPGSSA